jgi:hypothetical protein
VSNNSVVAFMDIKRAVVVLREKFGADMVPLLCAALSDLSDDETRKLAAALLLFVEKP